MRWRDVVCLERVHERELLVHAVHGRWIAVNAGDVTGGPALLAEITDRLAPLGL